MRTAARTASALMAALSLAAPLGGQEAARPRIETCHAEARGPDVFLRFRLAGALNPELATKIEAGLETTIRYDIRPARSAGAVRHGDAMLN